MSQKYEVVLLSPEDWEKTVASDPRYINANDSFGFSDPTKGKAYVRDMYWPELNKYLMNHELEHLMESEATHEDEFGIRHKGGFARTILPIVGGILGSFLLPGVGTALGGALGGGAGGAISGALGGGLGTALGAGAGTFGGAKIAGESTGSALLQGGLGAAASGVNSIFGNPLGKLAGGFAGGVGNTVGQVGSAISRAPVVGGIAQGIGNVAGGIGNVASGFGKAITAPLNNFSVGGSTPAPRVSAGGIGKPGGIKNLWPFGTNAVAPAAGAAGISPSSIQLPGAQPGSSALNALMAGGGKAAIGPASTASGLNGITSLLGPAGGTAAAKTGGGIMDSLKGVINPMTALGVGLPLAGNMFAKTPQIPDFGDESEYVKRLQNQLGKPASALGGAAQNILSQRLGSVSGITAPEESAIRRSFNEQRKNLKSQFSTIRPGADLATDSAYRQASFDLDQREAESIDAAQRQARGIQLQEAQTALGVDAQTMEQMTQLAQLDVARIMQQTGMDFQKASEFKQMFGQIGGAFLNKGLGINNGLTLNFGGAAA